MLGLVPQNKLTLDNSINSKYFEYDLHSTDMRGKESLLLTRGSYDENLHFPPFLDDKKIH